MTAMNGLGVLHIDLIQQHQLLDYNFKIEDLVLFRNNIGHKLEEYIKVHIKLKIKK